jgi:hypothetical protein
LPLPHEPPEQSIQEEGIPQGPLVEPTREPPPRQIRNPERLLQELLHFLRRKGRQFHHPSHALVPQGAGEVLRLPGDRSPLARAHGCQDTELLAVQVTSQEVEQLQRGMVRPVEILEDDENRLGGGQLKQEIPQNPTEPMAHLGGGTPGLGRRDSIRGYDARQKRRQLGGPATGEGKESLGSLGTEGGSQRLRDHTIGNPFLQRERPTLRDDPVLEVQAFQADLQQTALSHPGGSGNEEGAPLPMSHTADEIPDLSSTLVPPDEGEVRRGHMGHQRLSAP